MKRLLTICAIGFLLVATNAVYGGLWEIKDAGLQNAAFVDTGSGTDGTLNGRSDIAGDPGTQFSITLTGSGWQDIQIGDGFDLPVNNAGIVAATGNSGDLSGYTGYTMAIHNPGSTSFWATLYMNTGWTDPPDTLANDKYYQSGDGTGIWIGAGETKRLTLDFGNAALWNGSSWTTGQSLLDSTELTNIGFKIGMDFGTSSGTATFDVDVVPLPAAVLLGMLGFGAAGLKLRKFV